jgi:hypothetical protein
VREGIVSRKVVKVSVAALMAAPGVFVVVNLGYCRIGRRRHQAVEAEQAQYLHLADRGCKRSGALYSINGGHWV